MVKVAVWDLPLRLFHWALVLVLSFSASTGLLGEKLGVGVAEWHARAGYSIFALLLFRLLWGFCGGTHARFSSFVRGPRVVADYVRRALGGEKLAPLGHNPAGGWSVLAMLGGLSLQVGTGLFLADEDLAFEAPLSKYISANSVDVLKEVHEANFFVLAALIAMHLAAIAYYYFVKREDLVRPMLSGHRQLAQAPAEPARDGQPLLGALILAAAVSAVWALLRFS